MAYEDHIDDYQNDRNARFPFNDKRIELTHFEAAMKCASVIDAYLGGLELYRSAVRAVEPLRAFGLMPAASGAGAAHLLS